MSARTRGRLLVVAPHATRTGSTRVLLDLLGASDGELGVPLAVELLAGGPLEGALRALGDPPAPGEVPRAVLANSCLAAARLATVPAGVPTMVYVHETGEVLRSLPPAARDAIRGAQRVLCVSEAVQADVIAAGVAAERTVVLPPIVRARPAPAEAAVTAARALAGAGPEDRLVVGCGEATWRKGTDLFLEVARQVKGARFAWVGRRGRAMARQLDHDTERAGLADRMRWIGDVDDPAPFLAGADLVLMPSRDDPQPLVPLEAAQVGTATVGFDHGGLADLAADGAAAVAPYPDVAALAAAVTDLLVGDRRTALVDGARARLARRQAPEVVVPVFLAELRALL